MLSVALTAIALVATLQRDTTVLIGTVDRDLTGDGILETLRLVGTGRSVDSMQFTLTIDESGRTVYRTSIHLPSRAEYDRDRRPRTDYRTWLKDIGKEFFAETKFQSPASFLSMLRQNAEGHIQLITSVIVRDRGSQRYSASADQVWDEIQRSGVTTFDFSFGGDSFTVIAWSIRDQRFYRLVECC